MEEIDNYAKDERNTYCILCSTYPMFAEQTLHTYKIGAGRRAGYSVMW